MVREVTNFFLTWPCSFFKLHLLAPKMTPLCLKENISRIQESIILKAKMDNAAWWPTQWRPSDASTPLGFQLHHCTQQRDTTARTLSFYANFLCEVVPLWSSLLNSAEIGVALLPCFLFIREGSGSTFVWFFEGLFFIIKLITTCLEAATRQLIEYISEQSHRAMSSQVME